MTKASVKKVWGQIFCGEFGLGAGYALFKNPGDADIVKICLTSLVVAFCALFAIKLGTGAIAKIGQPTEDKNE